MRPLKILYVVHGYKPAFRIGGPIISVSTVAERLVAAGHEVTVFATNSDLDQRLDVPTNVPIDVEGVQVYYFEFEAPLKRVARLAGYAPRSSNYLYSPKMKMAMQTRIAEFDLVHTHLPFIFPTRLASQTAKQADIPLFYHQRGVLDPARLKFRPLKKRLYLELVEKNILSNANTLFALTSAEVVSYRRLGTTTPHVIVPNGIDAGQFRHKVDDSRFAAWGISPSDLIVLFLGRIHPLKGPQRIFEAFLRTAGRIPDSKLVLAGPDEFSLCAKLRALADASGLGGRVIIPGMVSGQTKVDLLARADLFVLPSEAEGFSMAILEAMASHTPVMISPGCHFDAVDRAHAGRIVANDAEEMANTLLTLLSDREELSALGHNARQLVERQFSWSNVVKSTIDAYQAGLERHGSKVAV